MALVSQELKAKLIMLPEKLKTKAGTIQNTVEKEDIKKAQNEWENRDYRDWNIIQYRIDGCQTASEKCSEILSKLQGPDSRKDAADLYKKMSGEMKRLKEQQLAAYQKWAVDQIEAARRRYESAKVGHWDIDAFSAFYETEFQEIDQRFLTPDVDQFLQGVFSILCNKLNAEGKAQLQREMAFPSLDRKPKRSLEKF